jgi:HK97 family phage portal protein
MGFWSGLVHDLQLGAASGAYPPDHPFWYTAPGAVYPTEAGVYVNEDSALKFSAVYGGTRLIAEAVASYSKRVFERLDGRNKRDAPRHPLTRLLRYRVSDRQTAFQWFEAMTASAILWGNGYSRLRLTRGELTGLDFWHPRGVSVHDTDTERPVYAYRDPRTGITTQYTKDEVFHLPNFGTDGVCGLSFIGLARQAIGVGQAQESHAARFFGQGTQLRGLLTTEQTLTDDQAKRNAETFNAAYGGLTHAHQVGVLDRGLKYEPIGMSAEDAQFVQSRDFQVRDFCRWLNLSETMLRIALRPPYTTPEHVLLEFHNVTMWPWVIRWESILNGDLVDDSEQFFVEFNMDSVHRADLATRGGFYASGIQNGYLSRNEVRQKENLEPVPGLDEYLVPANLQSQEAAEPTPTNLGPARQDRADEPDARTTRLVRAAARWALKRELAAIRAEATPRKLGDPSAWHTWVDGFYARHAAYLAQALGLELEAVRPYITHHRAELLAEGPAILASWEQTALAELCALAAVAA